MQIKKSITSRRSIRVFQPDSIPSECIQRAVETATYAPSWKNTQVPRYYAVSNPAIKEQIVECLPKFNQSAVISAPLVMICTVVKNRSGYNREGYFDTLKGTGWQMYDLGASNMLFCLGAKEEGLGTVIMGYFDEGEIARILEIPDTEEVSSVIAVGYPAEEPVMPKRKAVSAILKEII